MSGSYLLCQYIFFFTQNTHFATHSMSHVTRSTLPVRVSTVMWSQSLLIISYHVKNTIYSNCYEIFKAKLFKMVKDLLSWLLSYEQLLALVQNSEKTHHRLELKKLGNSVIIMRSATCHSAFQETVWQSHFVYIQIKPTTFSINQFLVFWTEPRNLFPVFLWSPAHQLLAQAFSLMDSHGVCSSGRFRLNFCQRR